MVYKKRSQNSVTSEDRLKLFSKTKCIRGSWYVLELTIVKADPQPTHQITSNNSFFLSSLHTQLKEVYAPAPHAISSHSGYQSSMTFGSLFSKSAIKYIKQIKHLPLRNFNFTRISLENPNQSPRS